MLLIGLNGLLENHYHSLQSFSPLLPVHCNSITGFDASLSSIYCVRLDDAVSSGCSLWILGVIMGLKVTAYGMCRSYKQPSRKH